MIPPLQPGDRVDYALLDNRRIVPEDFRTNGLVEWCRYDEKACCWMARVRWPKAEELEWRRRGVSGVGNYIAANLTKRPVTEQDLIDAGQAWRSTLDNGYAAAVDAAVDAMTTVALEGMRWQAQVRKLDGYVGYEAEGELLGPRVDRILDRVQDAMREHLMDEESGE